MIIICRALNKKEKEKKTQETATTIATTKCIAAKQTCGTRNCQLKIPIASGDEVLRKGSHHQKATQSRLLLCFLLSLTKNRCRVKTLDRTIYYICIFTYCRCNFWFMREWNEVYIVLRSNLNSCYCWILNTIPEFNICQTLAHSFTHFYAYNVCKLWQQSWHTHQHSHRGSMFLYRRTCFILCIVSVFMCSY